MSVWRRLSSLLSITASHVSVTSQQTSTIQNNVKLTVLALHWHSFVISSCFIDGLFRKRLLNRFFLGGKTSSETSEAELLSGDPLSSSKDSLLLLIVAISLTARYTAWFTSRHCLHIDKNISFLTQLGQTHTTCRLNFPTLQNAQHSWEKKHLELVHLNYIITD